MTEWASVLRQHGLSAAAAAAKAELFDRAAQALTRLPGASLASARAYFIPGRIEVLGKHTDYAGGSSLVVAAERGLCVLAAPRDGTQVQVADAVRDETIQFDLTPELVPVTDHWANYPQTVARRVARNFPAAARGAAIALASDLPAAAGMSSSSVLMVGVFFALADAGDIWRDAHFLPELQDPLNLAGYLATIENGQSYGPLVGDRGVGTFGGSEDHTAILDARPGHIRQYAYCPVRYQDQFRVPPEWTFAIAASGIAAEKTGGALERYNRASRLATAVADLWRRATGSDASNLAAILRRDADAPRRLRQILTETPHAEFRPPELLARLEHFLTENEQVIPAAGDALRRGDLAAFGDSVDRSQRAAERLLGNQVPETIHLARAARELGAAAASAFGAGFGGSVWALVRTSDAAEFLERWQQDYLGRFPARRAEARFFPSAAGPALCRVR